MTEGDNSAKVGCYRKEVEDDGVERDEGVSCTDFTLQERYNMALVTNSFTDVKEMNQFEERLAKLSFVKSYEVKYSTYLNNI